MITIKKENGFGERLVIDTIETYEVAEWLFEKYCNLLDDGCSCLQDVILLPLGENSENYLKFYNRRDFCRSLYLYEHLFDERDRVCSQCGQNGNKMFFAPNGQCLHCLCENYRKNNTQVDLRDYLQRYGVKHCIPSKINASRKPYMGFELEVVRGDNQCLMASDAENIINTMKSYEMLCKQDASVYAEFVSKPLLLSESIEKIDQCVDFLQPQGFVSWKGAKCGFHVHINKKSIKNESNLLEWFCQNHDLLRDFCGRDDDYYCKFDPELMRNNYTFRERRFRFSAINFLNSHTVEIRGFRGTLNKDRLHCYLKLADFFASYSDKLLNLSWDDIDFLVADDFLHNYLAEKQILDPTIQEYLKTKIKSQKNYKKQLKAFNCFNIRELVQLKETIQTRALFQ